ncbi:MAG: AAA family ATPase [Candidatus Heimdallarchaeota archaeon]
MPKRQKIICITGGKGGTGKTLVAVNLAVMYRNEGFKVLLIDGDVENPNSYLLLNGKLEDREEVPFFVPKIDEERCTKCGLCAENCLSHALLYIKDAVPIPVLNLCSGCKLCYKICPPKAIIADSRIIGNLYKTQIKNIDLLIGELIPSEARSAVIVKALMEKLDIILDDNPSKYDIIIFDTAPGAHCDVEELIQHADYIIPVTEPTKFGQLDLFRIIDLIKLLKKQFKVIVNRSNLLGFKQEFFDELKESNIQLLGDIPLDKDIVQSYCEGTPLMGDNSFNKSGEGYKAFMQIYKNLIKWSEIKA